MNFKIRKDVRGFPYFESKHERGKVRRNFFREKGINSPSIIGIYTPLVRTSTNFCEIEGIIPLKCENEEGS